MYPLSPLRKRLYAYLFKAGVFNRAVEIMRYRARRAARIANALRITRYIWDHAGVGDRHTRTFPRLMGWPTDFDTVFLYEAWTRINEADNMQEAVEVDIEICARLEAFYAKATTPHPEYAKRADNARKRYSKWFPLDPYSHPCYDPCKDVYNTVSACLKCPPMSGPEVEYGP